MRKNVKLLEIRNREPEKKRIRNIAAKKNSLKIVLWNRNRKNRNFLPCGTGTVTR